MSHEIYLPHRDITASLSTVIAAADVALTGDDRAVARQIALSLMTAGVGTVGEAIAVLEHASPTGRRRMLDDARIAAGLPPLSEPQKTAVEPTSDEIERDEAGAGYQVCHEPGCRACPVDPSTGAPRRSRAKRWRCSVHAVGHEADMEGWTSRIVLGPSGYVDLDAEEAERVREHREAEARAIVRNQRLAARAAELPAAEAERAAEDRAWRGANLMPPTERTA